MSTKRILTEEETKKILESYQVKTDSSLTTTNKNIVGAINEVNSKIPNVSAGANALVVKDTRNDNKEPLWYMKNYGLKTVSEFKNVSAVGLTSIFSSTYCNVLTIIPWSDSSGGYPTQIATDGQGNIAIRSGASNTTWSAWKSDIITLNSEITTLKNQINNKVDKVSGKGLSTNDFTTSEKNAVASNTSARHTHSNKAYLDKLSDIYINTLISEENDEIHSRIIDIQADNSILEIYSPEGDPNYFVENKVDGIRNIVRLIGEWLGEYTKLKDDYDPQNPYAGNTFFRILRPNLSVVCNGNGTDRKLVLRMESANNIGFRHVGSNNTYELDKFNALFTGLYYHLNNNNIYKIWLIIRKDKYGSIGFGFDYVCKVEKYADVNY